jgi:hypothetical protein
MAKPSKAIPGSAHVKLAKAVIRSRNPGLSLIKLSKLCEKLGEGWGIRVYWSSVGWEVELRYNYGIVFYNSSVSPDLLVATRSMAEKILRDIEDGLINIRIQN